jgi:hypothetical protein
MPEDLIVDISKQLGDRMEDLHDAIEQIERRIGDREEIPAVWEERVERAAAGVIAAVGALRALAEVAADDEEVPDSYPPGERG